MSYLCSKYILAPPPAVVAICNYVLDISIAFIPDLHEYFQPLPSHSCCVSRSGDTLLDLNENIHVKVGVTS